MHTICGRVLGVALAGMLALGGMVGCDSGPKSTEELLTRYEALESRDTYTYSSDLAVTLGGNQVVDYATTGEVTPEASHMSTRGVFFGHDASSERYVEHVDDAYVQYRSIDIKGVKLWARSAVDAVSPVSALTAPELLGTGSFAATEDGYTLAIPGASFMDVLVGMSEKVFPDIVETANIQKLWEGSSASEAVYTFNKDFELTGISCSVGSATDAATDDAAAGSESGSETGAFPGGTAYAIDVTYAIDGYGTVDPASVAVPQGVRNSSIDINEALAKAKSLAGEVVDKVGDFVGGLKDDLAERAREGIDQVSTYLENVDASELIDKFSSVVSDAA